MAWSALTTEPECLHINFKYGSGFHIHLLYYFVCSNAPVLDVGTKENDLWGIILRATSQQSHQSVSSRIWTPTSGREAAHRTRRVLHSFPAPRVLFLSVGGIPDGVATGQAHASDCNAALPPSPVSFAETSDSMRLKRASGGALKPTARGYLQLLRGGLLRGLTSLPECRSIAFLTLP